MTEKVSSDDLVAVLRVILLFSKKQATTLTESRKDRQYIEDLCQAVLSKIDGV